MKHRDIHPWPGAGGAAPGRRGVRLLTLVVMLAASASACAQTVLTEQESVRLGLARPDISTVIDATVDAARSDVSEAGRWPNPTLQYERESMPSAANRSVEHSYHLSQQLDLSGKRALRRDAARERLAATVADTEQRQLDMAGEIRRRFYEAMYRQRLLTAIEQWDGRMEAIAATVGKLHKGGEVAGYDRRRMALEHATAHTRLKVEQAEYDKAWQRLAAVLGEPELKATLSGELLPPDPPHIEAMLARVSRRPELRALDRRAGAFELERSAARRGWIPDVTVGIGSKTQDNGATRDSGTTVSLSVPLPLFDRNQAGQQRARAGADAARAEAGLLRSRLEGDLRGAWRQSQGLIVAAREYQAHAASASQDLVRIAEASYRGGETGILELLDAYRAALDAESRAWELSWNARQAAIDLDTIAGSGKP
jgi:cobalt-zinc-cadmium efflux system outer membrane protein